MSLRNRLALVLVVTLVIVQVLMAVTGVWYMRSIFFESGSKDLAIAEKVFEDQLAERSRKMTLRASPLAADRDLHRLLAEGDRDAIRQALRQYDLKLGAVHIGWVGPDGVVVVNSQFPNLENKPFPLPWFIERAVSDGQSAALFGRAGHVYWGVLYPVYRPALIGYIGVVFAFDAELVQDLLQPSSLPKSLTLATPGRDGIWVAAASSQPIDFDVNDVLAATASSRTPTMVELDGMDHISLVHPLVAATNAVPVVAILDFPMETYLDQDGLTNLRFMIPTLIAFAFGIVWVVIVARSVSKPVEAVARTAQRIQAGDYTTRPSVRESKDEVGRLSSAIAGMLEAINDRQMRLEAAISAAEYARDEAIRANQAKSNFLANMSHELRTPLNAVIGFAEIIKEEIAGPLDNPAYRDYARNILVSGKQLLALVEEMLDLARVEAGSYQIVRERVQTGAILVEVVEMLRLRAAKAGVAIDAPEHWASWPEIVGDPCKIRQAFTNLLANGIAYTPSGGRVGISASEEAGRLAIRFADTGIGINESDLPLVLKPFYRVHSANDGKYQGVGLGLPLVKAIVEHHGGTLEIESTLGKGTTVTVTFPSAANENFGVVTTMDEVATAAA